LMISATAGLLERFQEEQGRRDPELFEVRAQIVPGGSRELLVITPRDLILLGRGLPEGAEYLYFSPGWRQNPKIEEVKLKALDNRRGLEILVEHSEWAIPGEVRVKHLEIFGLRGGFLQRLFGQQLGEQYLLRDAQVQAGYKILSRGGLRIKRAQVKGFNPGNYRPVDSAAEMGLEPIPLPWKEKQDPIYHLQEGLWTRR